MSMAWDRRPKTIRLLSPALTTRASDQSQPRLKNVTDFFPYSSKQPQGPSGQWLSAAEVDSFELWNVWNCSGRKQGR